MQDISAPPAHAEPAPRKKARIKLAVRLVVSAGLVVALVFGVRGVHLGEVASRLSAFPVSGVALALGAGLLQVLAQLVRLWSLFPRGARPRLSTVGRGFAWGQLLNMFLPARAGEVVKVVSIARAQPIPGAPQPTMTQTTGAILADKIVDLVTMLALGLCMLPQLLTLPLPSPRTLAMVLPLVAAGVVLGWRLLRRFAPNACGKVRAAAAAVLSAIVELRDPLRLSRGILLSAASAILEMVGIALLASAVGVHLGPVGALTVLVLVCVGSAVPVSVANLGAFEGAVALGLHRYGAGASDAVAVGLVHHMVQLAAIALMALFFWIPRALARRPVAETQPAAA